MSEQELLDKNMELAGVVRSLRANAREDAAKIEALTGEVQKLRYQAQVEDHHHDRMVCELEKVYKERDEAREAEKNWRITASSLRTECEELREALNRLDEAILLMKPRYIGHPTMDGRYPCWVVWLPKGGKVERKSLRDAFLEFFAQIKEAAK